MRKNESEIDITHEFLHFIIFIRRLLLFHRHRPFSSVIFRFPVVLPLLFSRSSKPRSSALRNAPDRTPTGATPHQNCQPRAMRTPTPKFAAQEITAVHSPPQNTAMNADLPFRYLCRNSSYGCYYRALSNLLSNFYRCIFR